MIFRIFTAVLFLLAPLLSFAQVEITEIVYDPKDTDATAGGEWIEIQNTGSAVVDLTQWIFFEALTNHGITADALSNVPAGGYAVISRDLVAFKNYFPNFSGLLFKASFSLNDGETLAMKESKDAPVTDSVSYTSEWGAKNDGNSLQKMNSAWIMAPPTPGATNVDGSGEDNSETPEETPTATVQENATNVYVPEPKPTIIVDAGPSKRIALVGADAVFNGVAHGLQGEIISNARFIWSFGDGSIKEGKSVSHAYRYPGEYIVILEGSSGEYSASDKILVTVIPAQISIDSIGASNDFFVSLKNGTKYEINLEGWVLRSGNTRFMIPANTFIVPSKNLQFAQNITGLPYSNDIVLLYPSGATASAYGGSVQISQKSESTAPTLPEVFVLENEKAQSAPVLNTSKSDGTAIVSDADSFEANERLATALEVVEEPSGEIFKWVLIFISLVAVSLGGLFIVLRLNPNDTLLSDISAEEFTIIEEEEK